MEAKLTVEIGAAPEVVFDWVTKPECVIQWLNHLSQFEFLDDAEPCVNARFKQTWDDEGENSEIIGTIVDYVPSERYAIHLDAKGFQVDVAYRFTKVDKGTQLTQKTTFDYKGIMKMIEKVVGGKIRRSYEDEAKRNLAKLMDLCEAKA